jgi:demethylmenaquinone methyltransferase/2-methoxy-6-polyprenyl-1,4-benzoquinol methylase
MRADDPYEAEFVRDLFGEMASTYGITNLVSSVGFCQRWRHQCIQLAAVEPGMAVCDLMSGMGETWNAIGQRLQGTGSIVALDFCPQMCASARRQQQRHQLKNVSVLEEDVLSNSIPSGSADRVVSSFGLKTFSDRQARGVAEEIARILKPDGRYSLLEISVPRAAFLRWPYMFYLRYVVPILGLLFLGNPRCYRMLGVYTAAFGNCSRMAKMLREAGLQAEYRELFFGCASAVVGGRSGPTNGRASAAAAAEVTSAVVSPGCVK